MASQLDESHSSTATQEEQQQISMINKDKANEKSNGKTNNYSLSMTLQLGCLICIIAMFYFAFFQSTAIQQWEKELVQSMIPTDQLAVYEKSYKKVNAAIYSIAPESRQISKSHRVNQIPLSRVDDIIPVLIEHLATDLQVDKLEEDVVKKIKYQIKYAKLGMKGAKDRYAKIKLSFERGGRSHIIVGAVGFKAVSNDEILFGVSLYQEHWKEHEWVRLNKHAEVWQDTEVEKFAFYLLYKNLQSTFGLYLS
eukprot:489032_1